MTKQKSGDPVKGIRFDPELTKRVEGYVREAQKMTGLRVQFSEAVRVLVDAGLERWEERGKFGVAK
jgi:hypothetical protein